MIVLCLLGTQAYVFVRATPLDKSAAQHRHTFLCTVKGGGEILA